MAHYFARHNAKKPALRGGVPAGGGGGPPRGRGGAAAPLPSGARRARGQGDGDRDEGGPVQACEGLATVSVVCGGPKKPCCFYLL